jgi:hypothetical protein
MCVAACRSAPAALMLSSSECVATQQRQHRHPRAPRLLHPRRLVARHVLVHQVDGLAVAPGEHAEIDAGRADAGKDLEQEVRRLDLAELDDLAFVAVDQFLRAVEHVLDRASATDVAGRGRGERTDPVPPHHQAVGLERGERASHRRARHAEPRGELVLARQGLR